jgi:hypothetical protein
MKPKNKETTNRETTNKNTTNKNTTKAARKAEDTFAAKTAAAIPVVQKVEDGLDLIKALDPSQRRQLDGVIRTTGDDVIGRVLALARRHDGVIAGIPFDVPAAEAALADAEAAFALSSTLKTLARRLDDTGARSKGGVAEQVTAVVMALRGLVRTPQGEALGQELVEITRAKRATRKTRRAVPADGAAKPAPKKSAGQTDTKAQPAPSDPQAPPPQKPVPGGNATLSVPLGQPTVTLEGEA